MIPLPGYNNPEAWAGFVEMRRASGKTRPFTTRAATLILYELQRIKDAGHDPNAALDQSTRMGWADVWPPKTKDLGAAYSTGESERRQREAEEWAKRTPEQIEAAKRIKEQALGALKVVR
jgi:hypothetical protein